MPVRHGRRYKDRGCGMLYTYCANKNGSAFLKLARLYFKKSPWHQAELTSSTPKPAGLYPPCWTQSGKLNSSNKALILPLHLQYHYDTKLQSNVLKECPAFISRGQAKHMGSFTTHLIWTDSETTWRKRIQNILYDKLGLKFPLGWSDKTPHQAD